MRTEPSFCAATAISGWPLATYPERLFLWRPSRVASTMLGLESGRAGEGTPRVPSPALPQFVQGLEMICWKSS